MGICRYGVYGKLSLHHPSRYLPYWRTEKVEDMSMRPIPTPIRLDHTYWYGYGLKVALLLLPPPPRTGIINHLGIVVVAAVVKKRCGFHRYR